MNYTRVYTNLHSIERPGCRCRVTFADTQEPKVMKARTFIGGATVVLIAGAILGYSATVPERCAAWAALSVSDFDPFKSPQSEKPKSRGWIRSCSFRTTLMWFRPAFRINTDPGKRSNFYRWAGGVGQLPESEHVPHVAKGIGWLKPPWSRSPSTRKAERRMWSDGHMRK